MNTPTYSNKSSTDIDLGAVAGLLWNRKWLVLTCCLVGVGVLAGVALVMTPIYRASAVLVAGGSDGGAMGSRGSALSQLGGLASLAGISIGSGASQIDEALAVLQSREFTEGFVRDQHLMSDLFPGNWDQKTGEWRGEPSETPTLAKAYIKFDKSIRSVNYDRKSGLISLQIEWRDPLKAAAWANMLVKRLNAEMRARAIRNTNAAIEYLERELANTPVTETRLAINRLMESQINQRMFANVTEDYALRIVDRAMPPDATEVIRPRKVQFMALGVGLGFLAGAALALILGVKRT